MGTLSPKQRAVVKGLAQVAGPASELAPALRATLASAAQGAAADQALAAAAALQSDVAALQAAVQPSITVARFEQRQPAGTAGGLLAPLAPEPTPLPPPGGNHYYVSSVHVNRNDANDGTSPDAPWATFDRIKTAWSSFVAGDTVHLEKGSRWTWSGQWYWIIEAGGGAAGNPVTIRGDDYGTGAKPILEKVGGSNVNTTFWVRGGSHITFRDFIVDGGLLAGYGTTAFYLGGHAQTVNVAGIQILNMTLRQLGNGADTYCDGIWLHPNGNHSVSDCLIEGNEITQFSSHGLNHYAPKAYTARTQNLIHRCVYRNNRMHSASPQRAQGYVSCGIHIACGGSDNVFEYNYINGGFGLGSIYVHNNANDETNLIIRHNVVTGNTDSNGIQIGTDATVQGTTIQGSLYGNFVSGSKYSGLSIEPLGYYTGAFNIYNNVFYDNVKSAANVAEVYVAESNTLSLNFVNNIIVHLPGYGTGLLVNAGYTGSMIHSNNLYWHTSGGTIVNFKGASYTPDTVESFEASSEGGDPLFVNVALLPTSITSTAGISPDGFALQDASPALGSGYNLGTTFNTSVNRVTRPATGFWDMGVYQTGDAPPPEDPPDDPPEDPEDPPTTTLQTRTMNTTLYNTIAGAGLADGRVLIPAGRYVVEAFATASGVGPHKAELFANGVSVAAGTPEIATDGVNSKSLLTWYLDLTTLTILELGHRVTTSKGTNDGGIPCNLAGLPEVYAAVTLWRL